MKNLVLLHGWGMSRRVWESVIPGLSEGFLVHNLNLPGYGIDNGSGTDERYQSMSPGDILDDWSDKCLSAAPSGAIWMGWSLGAMVAMNAVSRAPGEIEALILVSATPKFVKSGDWENGAEDHVMRGFLNGFRTEYSKTLRRFMFLQAGDAIEARRLAGRLTDALADETCEASVLESGLDVLEQVDLRPVLHRIDVPVRIVHGRADRIVPYTAGAYLAGNLQTGELISLDTGHAPFVTQPREFLAAVQA